MLKILTGYLQLCVSVSWLRTVYTQIKWYALLVGYMCTYTTAQKW